MRNISAPGASKSLEFEVLFFSASLAAILREFCGKKDFNREERQGLAASVEKILGPKEATSATSGLLVVAQFEFQMAPLLVVAGVIPSTSSGQALSGSPATTLCATGDPSARW